MNRNTPSKAVQARISGGQWRGRRLVAPRLPGLRPSGSRGREVLFNWLQGHIAGAHCLDAFAGTGSLAFEALSRGAAHATLLEQDRRAAAALRASAEQLQAEAKVQCVDALVWLRAAAEPRYDIAFIDPPFDAQLWAAALSGVMPWLRPGALLYLEMPVQSDHTSLVESDRWTIRKQKRLGQVHMLLLELAPL